MIAVVTDRTLRRAIGIAIALVVSAATTSAASAEIVSIDGNRFVPEGVRVDLGSVVRWVNEADIRHRIASVPLGFFRTSRIRPGTTSELVPFDSAGSFAYKSKTRPRLRGRVGVPVEIRPGRNTTPTPGAVIRIQVAAERVDGLVYDIQRRRDDGAWKMIREDTSRPVIRFRPQQVGTYSFRARVTDTALGISGMWSPSRHKDVAPPPQPTLLRP